MNSYQNLWKQTFSKFIWQVFLWNFGCLSFLFFLILVINVFDFQWLYRFSPELYYFFRDWFYFIFKSDLFFVFLILICIFGNFYLVYRLICKLFSYIQAIYDASSLLFSSDVDYIELPRELEEIQKHLNSLKKESMENERIAKEQEVKKNDLIVYLAHDLKTPLTSLIGYLSLLEEIKDMPKKQREKYIKIALDKSYKLEDLINELFEIARFNAEKIILEPEKVHLNLMMEQIIDDFYPVLQEQSKQIILCQNDSVDLFLDPNQMARVFNNLFRNAIFYSNTSEIFVNILKKETSVQVEIRNSGKNIPTEKLKHIFEKFYRADSSRSLRTGGSGLGLSIAKEIVELHGGKIWATSERDQTTFYVSLPILKS